MNASFTFAPMRKLSMDELERKSVEEFKQAEKAPLIVVLDNIRSMHNVGSVFRTSDAFLVNAIFICGYTAQPPHAHINKTALGATETVDWMYYTTSLEAIKELKSNGYKVYGIEQTVDSISLETIQFSPEEKIAVIFGNEVTGVEDAVLEICDGSIEIPQLGMKHSLNISVAAGIVLWKLSEQRFVNLSKVNSH